LNRSRFDKLVAEAIASLPPGVAERMENLEVVIADWPTRDQLDSVALDPELDTLFGLYEGVPLSDREHNFGMALPDRITLFYYPLVETFIEPSELREEIRTTLIHEVGHFLGLDEDEIEDLGY